jgi:hypothetical protein
MRIVTQALLAFVAAGLAWGGCDSGAQPNATDGGGGIGDGSNPDLTSVASGGDDGGGNPGSPDLATSFPAGVPTFFAIGKYARITTSCDDGRSWTFNRSDDDNASCVGIDCDHHPGSATGVTWGDGYFYGSFGWGDHPSRIFRSRDGQKWDPVYNKKEFSFAGVVWAGDRLVGGDPTPRYSMDRGVTWSSAAWPPYMTPNNAWPNARQVGYTPMLGGRIAVIVNDGQGTWGDIVVSSNGGTVYTHPTSLPSDCRGHSRPPATGNGVWLQVWGTTGRACRSTDGGVTWTSVQAVPAGDVTNPVFTGREFIVYQGDKGYRSTDGAAWTSFDITVPGGAQLGPVAFSPVTNTFVSVRGGWDVWYEKQRFYRSTDGITWTELASTAARRSHPITHIGLGWAEPSAACPAP